MIRKALWWADEHRGIAGLAVAVAVAAIAALALSGGEDARGGRQGQESVVPFAASTEDSIPASELRRDRMPEGAGELAALKDTQALPQETPNVPHAREPSCAEVRAPGLVAGEARGLSCAEAAEIAAGYEPAAGEDAAADVGGSVCTPDTSGLAVGCVDPLTGASASFAYGPGGAGLRDCGQVPVGTDAPTLVAVRASIDCDDAGAVAFAWHVEPSAEVEGYRCRELEQRGVESVECLRGGDEVAFVVARPAR